MDLITDLGYELPPTPNVDAGGMLHYPNAGFAAIPGYRPLRLDLRVPPGPGPVPLVVWIHGGAWWSGSRLGLPETLGPVGFYDRVLRRGYAIASVDYRLSREAVFPAQLHDVQAAIRWLREFAKPLRLDPDRVAVWGESAGGHLAALAALTGDSRNAVQAVVDWYGVAGLIDAPDCIAAGTAADPAEWLLGGPLHEREAEVRQASPLHQVHPGAPPFLLMHGTDDQVVPAGHSELLAAALRDQGVRADLHLVPGADHVFFQAPDVGALVETSLDFIDEVLPQPSEPLTQPPAGSHR